MAGFRLKPELCPWLSESDPVKPPENREVADFLEKLRSIQMDDDIEGDLDDLISAWQSGDGRGLTLRQYLGMSELEYAAFEERREIPPGYRAPRHPDIEGDDPPEYTAPADRTREVCVGLLTLAVVVSFFFGVCWLADRIGGGVR